MRHSQSFPLLTVLLASLALLSSGCPRKPPAPVGPQAAFTAEPLSGLAPLAVQFTDTSTPGSAAITSWNWNFGDATTATTKNPVHIY